MEDNLNILLNGRQPKIHSNGRRPQYSSKVKATSRKIMQPKIIEIKTMVVAPLRIT
jgi:hypothetical protein